MTIWNPALGVTRLRPSFETPEASSFAKASADTSAGKPALPSFKLPSPPSLTNHQSPFLALPAFPAFPSGTSHARRDGMSTESFASPPLPTSRWLQLLFGLVCMMAISSTQYVWTLFTGPFTTHLGATLAQVQVTISILIVLQTFLSPFQGYLVDLFGPRTLLSIGAIFSAASWVLAATVKTTLGLYLTYGLLGGIGTGIIYVR